MICSDTWSVSYNRTVDNKGRKVWAVLPGGHSVGPTIALMFVNERTCTFFFSFKCTFLSYVGKTCNLKQEYLSTTRTWKLWDANVSLSCCFNGRYCLNQKIRIKTQEYKMLNLCQSGVSSPINVNFNVYIVNFNIYIRSFAFVSTLTVYIHILTVIIYEG